MADTKEAVNPVTPEVTEPAQTTETKEPEIDYKTELEKSKQEVIKWEKEAKAHQSTASKKAEEARKWQEKMAGIDARLDALAEVMEESLKQPATEELEQPQKKPSFKERLAEKTKTLPQPEFIEQQEKIKNVASEIMELEKQSGLKFDKSKELREAYTEWRLGNYDEALNLVKEVTGKMVETKVDPKEKELAEAKKEIERLKKVMSGELDSEKGQPVGTNNIYSRSQIAGMSISEYESKRADIEKAQKEGRIKE
jgi:hypothetical protein